MGRMELSQRLDLAKLGLDPDLVPEDTDTDDKAVAAEGSIMAQLASLFAKVGAVEDAEAVSAEDTFDSLGVDSLTRIELAVRAEEHFGVRVDADTLDPASTVGEMAAFFSDNTANTDSTR